MFRCEYVAHAKIAAVRLNGKNFPRSRPVPAEAAGCQQELGQFVIHGGVNPGYFVAGTNIVEFDVNNSLPGGSPKMLRLWLEVSGIRITPVNSSPLEISGAKPE